MSRAKWPDYVRWGTFVKKCTVMGSTIYFLGVLLSNHPKRYASVQTEFVHVSLS